MARWLLNGYRFCSIDDPLALVAAIDGWARPLGLTGSVLVAREGINLALFGARPAVEAVQARVEDAIDCDLVDVLWTAMAPGAAPFRRLRVRERSEIVTFGLPCDAAAPGAQDVPPRAWNALIARPDVRVIDVRNDYEVALGSFAGAEDPGTASFTEFRDYVERELAQDMAQPIAMFCTGGIRCAKAGAWMRGRGFTQVYQLQGGILGYLGAEDVDRSAWRGECFVFDDRAQLPSLPAADALATPAVALAATASGRADRE
jgi:UPF0176 protein